MCKIWKQKARKLPKFNYPEAPLSKNSGLRPLTSEVAKFFVAYINA